MHRCAALSALLALVACTPSQTPAPPSAAFSANLVTNGDAESGSSSALSSPPVSSVLGWTRPPVPGSSENATVLTYAGYKMSYGLTVAGPPGANLGLSVFMGGNAASSTLEQVISLAGLNLKPGVSHPFRLSALLGGAEGENDHVDVTLEGLDRDGLVTVSGQLNGPRAQERGNVTQLLPFALEGTLPAGVSAVRLRLAFTRESGTLCEGFADNLELRVGLDGG